jgi:CspA family cold shock protein
MTPTGKLVISLIIAAIASIAAALLQGGPLLNPVLLACFCAATLATAALTSRKHLALTSRKHPADTAPDDSRGVNGSATEANREQGKVKWFNVSKGFGFITKDDGDEIFVHFRSIRGEGRRALRDGQRVTFFVGESAKGPQAEDVVILDP